ncbi:hypothetical protein Unana1_01034 [Umbelopsis nana]
MTDLFMAKPVVKLPQRRGSVSFREDTTDDLQTYNGEPQPNLPLKHGQYATTSLASDKTLYIKDLSRRVSSEEVLDALNTCDPQSIHLDEAGSFSIGYVRFAKDEDAEQAHALYNGTIFEDGSRLHLYFTDGDQEPEPSAVVLQVNNLASEVTSNDVYYLFRTFGPLGFCTIVSDEPNVDIRGSALVQFYEQDDADAAESELHGKEYHGKTLSIHPMLPATLQVPDLAIQMNDVPNTGASKDALGTSPSYPYQPMERQMPLSVVGQDAYSEIPIVNIDFTNLYIKNLDLNIKSSDLFNLFRKFGRIISARVMNNAQTGISKGFGFVSFSKAEEAFMALQEMNGKLILSKHIIVAYHEPKKPRSERAYLQSYAPPQPPGAIPPAPIVFRPDEHVPLQFHNQPPPMMMGYHPTSGSYPPTYPYNEDYVTGSVNRIVKKYSNNALRQHQPSEGNSDTMSLQAMSAALPPISTVPSTATSSSPGDGPSLSSLASGASVQLPPKVPVPKQKTLRRNSMESVSSVMTESSSDVQRLRMAEAVKRAGETSNTDDIVDMLLTLKRKERSLCLFNPDFLKSKIKLAKEALELFVDECGSHPEATLPLPTGLSRDIPAEGDTRGHDSSHFESYLTNEQYQVLHSNYNTAAQKSQSQQGGTSPSKTSVKATHSEIDSFLASIQGYTLFEKKQKLGDRLFPLVKATGTKHAPKITIRLLDTIELYDLAHLMHDKTKLKAKVDEAFTMLQQ